MSRFGEGRCLRVALVRTAPEDGRGSMPRYADLVEEALLGDAGSSELLMRQITLGPPVGFLQGLPPAIRGWARHAAVATRAYSVLPSVDADIVHLLDGSHAYVARWLPDTPFVATCHDVIPLLQTRGEIEGPRPGRLAGGLIRESLAGLRRARRVFADSSNTRDDLVREGEVAAARIRVVHPALPDSWREQAAPSEGGDGDPEGPLVVLHVGHDGFYKNRAGVVRIFGCVAEEVDAELVMVGPRPDQELLDLVRSLDLGDRISWRSELDEDSLRSLYRSASLFLFPSLYEGFGWPPLEAMACGCPVVCSSAGSLAEVAAPGAVALPPEDEAGLARACVRLLRDPDEAERVADRGRRHAAAFTLERMGRELMEGYRAALTPTSESVTADVVEVP